MHESKSHTRDNYQRRERKVCSLRLAMVYVRIVGTHLGMHCEMSFNNYVAAQREKTIFICYARRRHVHTFHIWNVCISYTVHVTTH